MKNFIWLIIGVFASIGITYGAFESDKITATDFCLGLACLNNRSIISGSLPGRITVSTNALYTGVKQAIDWINANATHPYEILIDAGDRDITDTITINASFPITIRGLGFETTTLLASGGLEGEPMFDIQSSVEFSNLNIDASGLAGHGSALGEDGFKITATGNYIQIDNVGIYGFNKGISLETDSEMRVFNSALEDNVAYGVYISGGDYRSAETDYNNSLVGVYLYAGSGKFFSTEHDSYLTNSGQIAIGYAPTSYTNYLNVAIFNDNFKIDPNGFTLSGFDFTLERDANVEIYGNIGMEDYRPHAHVSLEDGIATGRYYLASGWTKLEYTLSNIYTKKRTITTTGRITFLSDHMKSVQMRLSASMFTTSQQADMKYAIIKNSNTGDQYGLTRLNMDSDNRMFQFSLNAYLDDVKKGDYFEIWVKDVGSGVGTVETIGVQDLNRLIDSR